MTSPTPHTDVAKLAWELYIVGFPKELEHPVFKKWQGFSDVCFTAAESFFLSAQWDKENRTDANNN